MKKLFNVLLVIILILLVCLAGYKICLNIQKHEVLKMVDGTFTEVKNGDLSNYMDNQSKDESNKINQYTKSMLGNIDYKVLSIDQEYNKAKVKISVSNKDMKTIFQRVINKAMDEAFKNIFDNKSKEEIDKEVEKYFLEELKSKDIKVVTNTIDLEYVKANGNWEINIDRMKFLNSILPGYTDLKNSISSLKD